MSDPDLPAELLGALRKLVIATIVLYVVLAGVMAFVFIDGANKRNDIAQVALSTNHALCVLRLDLEQRVTDAEQFLVEHPDGIPGITPETIQQSIDNQHRTIDALSDLDCVG